MPNLPAATHLGTVNLAVADLDRQLAFYTGPLGLHLLARTPGEARLGAGGRELLRLTLKPGARRYEDRTGLYHFCLLVPQRLELGRLLRRLLDAHAEFHGLVDHRAAEAIYLPDPEGNGIELNWDRPRDLWAGRFKELIRLGNGPLDIEGLLALADQAGPGDGKLPADAGVGHVHLHVQDLEGSRAFYHGVLGFDVTAEYPRQAVFTSAGGYHHHVAFNVWHGHGAPEPPADAGGLRWFTVQLPDQASLQAALGRLRSAGLDPRAEDGGWLALDPSGNGVLLKA